MRPLERVDKIKADIAALPEVYRPLVMRENTFAAQHPRLWTAICVAVGIVLCTAYHSIRGF